MLLSFGQSAALQQPFNASAVWTTINESFHVCWDSHNTSEPKPAPIAYIIRDRAFVNLSIISYHQGMKSYCADLIQPSTYESGVFIQAVSWTALPSDLLHLSISGK